MLFFVDFDFQKGPLMIIIFAFKNKNKQNHTVSFKNCSY